MAVNASEEEQIEALRRWWSANGKSVIAGVVVAIIAVVAWDQWQNYQRSQSLSASATYEAMVADLGAGNADKAGQALKTLREDYADSVYATLASLSLAGHQVEAGNLSAAADTLRWARDHVANDALSQLTRLRLAQVLDGAEQRDEALKVLDPVPSGPFAARFHELIGDIRAASGDRDAAVEAYRKAVAANPMARRRDLIEMKLAGLSAEVEPTS